MNSDMWFGFCVGFLAASSTFNLIFTWIIHNQNITTRQLLEVMRARDEEDVSTKKARVEIQEFLTGVVRYEVGQNQE